MSRRMGKAVMDAIEELTKNFDAEFGTGRHKDSADTLMHHRQRKVYNVSDEEESSCDSSFNQVVTRVLCSLYYKCLSCHITVSCYTASPSTFSAESFIIFFYFLLDRGPPQW